MNAEYQALWLEREALLRFKQNGPGTFGPTAQLRLAVLDDRIADLVKAESLRENAL